MKLLVIRHGRAERVKEFAKTGASDELRPLTADGEERLRQVMAGLGRLVKTIDLVTTSPLVRARQTADILATALDAPEVVELEELRPGAEPSAFAEWLQEAGAEETFAAVGHETHLRELVGWLLTGKADQIVEIKKGGVVMLDVRARGRRRVGPRSGTLLWSLAPRQLRALGG